MKKKYNFHPACLLFPQMSEEELDDLAEDIQERGLLNPIVLYKEKILDGRNRYLAMKRIGMTPRFVEWDGKSGFPFRWVLSQNLTRRHLNASQRSLIAFEALPHLEQEAKARQRYSRGRGKKGVQKLDRFSTNGRATKIAASLTRSNHTYVQQIKAISKTAPELLSEIKSGKLKIPDAIQLSKLNKAQRSKVLKKLANGESKKTIKRTIRQVELEASRSKAKSNGYHKHGQIEIWNADCVEAMAEWIESKSISTVVTSPPYWQAPFDPIVKKMTLDEYLDWLAEVFEQIKRVLRDDGSFFLNIGFAPTSPWSAMKVCELAGEFFHLQNQIIWVKSISIEERTFGHFDPMNSERFLDHNWEYLFHFTKNGKVKLNKLGVGVPYQDKSNLMRNSAKGDVRPEGNVWFIPYSTRKEKGEHPTAFPIELARRCTILHGVKSNSYLLDPMCGSGSSLLAAARLGMPAIGIDRDEYFCEVSRRRVEEINHQ